MPSATDKAFQLSSSQHRFYRQFRSKEKAFIRQFVSIRKLFGAHLNYRLGNRHTDMPQAGAARGLQTRQVSFSEARKKDTVRVKTERQASPAALPDEEEQTTLEDSHIQSGCPLKSQTDYSESKISSPTYLEQSIGKQVRDRRQSLVDSLMSSVLACLGQQLDSFEELCDGESFGSDASSNSSSSGHNRQISKKPTSGYKRQIREDDSDGQGDDNHGGDDRRDKHNKRTRRSAEDEREKIFACPYYKFAPDQCRSCRTCAMPSFKEIHRLKEHVMRKHRLPEQCLRCCEFFKTEQDLKAHAQSPKGCRVGKRERNLSDGFDKLQERKLNERPRMDAEARWRHMYCILFNIEPNSPDIPSPYHDDPETGAARAGRQERRRSQPITRVIRDRLPALVHTAVESQVWKATSTVENEILPKVIEELRSSIQNAVHVLQSIPPPPPTSYANGKEAMIHYQEAPVEDFDVDEFLSCLPSALEPQDGFDFGSLDAGLANELCSASSSTPSSGDGTTWLANTSVSSVGEPEADKETSHSCQRLLHLPCHCFSSRSPNATMGARK